MRVPFRIAVAGSLALLSLLAACGGGGGGSTSTPTATSLSYTDPSSGGYRLVRDASSTATHLVLDLVGPDSTSLSGIGFHLTVDPAKATWGTVGSGWVSTSVFTNPVVKAQVQGGALQAGVYQLGSTSPVTATSSAALGTVALDLNSAAKPPAGSAVALTAGKALILEPPGSSGATTAITITVGSLVAH
jgi:hypothetical protein